MKDSQRQIKILTFVVNTNELVKTTVSGCCAAQAKKTYLS